MTDHLWWGEYEDYKTRREAGREEKRKMYEERVAKELAEAYWDGEFFMTDAERERRKAWSEELRRKAERRSEAHWEAVERIGWTGDEREG